MKNAPKPQDKEPQPAMVVAVPSIEFAFTIWNAQTGRSETTALPKFALWNPETGDMRRVIGGNVCQNTVYLNGIMPKVFRMAVADEDYAYERILTPSRQLPPTIEEVALDETPELKLVMTNYTLVPIPEMLPEKKPKESCMMITHPAVFERPQPQKEAKVLPLFPDYNPQKLLA